MTREEAFIEAFWRLHRSAGCTWAAWGDFWPVELCPLYRARFPRRSSSLEELPPRGPVEGEGYLEQAFARMSWLNDRARRRAV